MVKVELKTLLCRTFVEIERKVNNDSDRESRKQNRDKKVGMVNVYENGKIL